MPILITRSSSVVKNIAFVTWLINHQSVMSIPTLMLLEKLKKVLQVYTFFLDEKPLEISNCFNKFLRMNTEGRSGRFVFSAASKRRLLSNLNREQSLKGILLKLFDLLLFQWGPSYFSVLRSGIQVLEFRSRLYT